MPPGTTTDPACTGANSGAAISGKTSPRAPNPLLATVIMLAAIGVFAVDLGIRDIAAFEILYLGTVLLTLWVPGRTATVSVAALCTLLTTTEGFLSLSHGANVYAVLHHPLTLLMIWSFAGLILRRKKSELALVESRQLLDQAEEIAGIGSWDFDLRSQPPQLRWSRQMYRLFGVDPVTFDGSREAAVRGIHPDDIQQLEEAERVLLGGGESNSIEYRIILPNAGERIVRAESRLVKDASGRAIRLIGSVQDITKWRKAEQSLRKSREKYRCLVENLRDDYFVYRHGVDGVFTYISPSIRAVLGYSPDEFMRHYSTYLTDSPVNEDVERHTELSIRGEKQPTYEVDIYHKDGSIRRLEVSEIPVFDEAKVVVAVEGIAHDITARVRAEEALEESRARAQSLATILENSSQPIAVVHPDGGLGIFNAAFCELTGYSADDLQSVGRLEQLTPPSPAERETITPGSPFPAGCRRPHQQELVRKDGTCIPVEVLWHVVQESAGNADHYCAFVTDISQRLHMEEELVRAKRLESAGQLAGQIAHDFNNLLGPLVIYPQVMRDRLPADSPLHAMLSDMSTAATRIADINQELLTLGRRGHYNRDRLDLNGLIDCLLRTVTIPPAVRVERDLDTHPLPVRGGNAQLSRAVTNIIVNALDAMNGNGHLTIRTRSVRLDRPLRRYNSVEAGEYVRLDISDTGPGIPEDILDKIFEPFFTTKEADRRRGSGLGLSVVYAVMEDHQGYVDIETGVPGRGTTFSLFLPAFRGEGNAEREPADVARGNGERVLVVDDEPLQLRIARSVLGSLGYSVETASSGEEAVEAAISRTPDLAIIDMMMPGIDGAETLRQIRTVAPDLPAIIFSGFAGNDRVDAALAMGNCAFLAKPMELAGCAQAVETALHGRVQYPVKTPA